MVGIIAVGLAGWSWGGRTPRARWWFHHDGYHSFVLGALPGMGLLLVVGGLHGLVGEAATPYLVPLFIVGVAVVFIGIAKPRWWGPSWYRAAPDRMRGRGSLR